MADNTDVGGKTLGQVAHEAYWVHVIGFKDTSWTDTRWHLFAEPERQRWEEMAQAVATQVRQESAPVVDHALQATPVVDHETSNVNDKLTYPKQDHEALGDYYLRHIDRMTIEGLHKKSAIAAQLAWRDKVIDELRAAGRQESGKVSGEWVERAAIVDALVAELETVEYDNDPPRRVLEMLDQARALAAHLRTPNVSAGVPPVGWREALEFAPPLGEIVRRDALLRGVEAAMSALPAQDARDGDRLPPRDVRHLRIDELDEYVLDLFDHSDRAAVQSAIGWIASELARVTRALGLQSAGSNLLIADALSLTRYAAAPFFSPAERRVDEAGDAFVIQPTTEEWWAGLRVQIETLQPKLSAAIAASAGKGEQS